MSLSPLRRLLKRAANDDDPSFAGFLRRNALDAGVTGAASLVAAASGAGAGRIIGRDVGHLVARRPLDRLDQAYWNLARRGLRVDGQARALGRQLALREALPAAGLGPFQDMQRDVAHLRRQGLPPPQDLLTQRAAALAELRGVARGPATHPAWYNPVLPSPAVQSAMADYRTRNDWPTARGRISGNTARLTNLGRNFGRAGAGVGSVLGRNAYSHAPLPPRPPALPPEPPQ